MTDTTNIQTSELPTTIRTYLAAHAAGEADAALRTFAADAVVTDEGSTHRGTDQIEAFLHRAGAEFTYTTELVGAQRVDGRRWVAVNRLEGDFPGGVVELQYRFTLADDLIVALDIAP